MSEYEVGGHVSRFLCWSVYLEHLGTVGLRQSSVVLVTAPCPPPRPEQGA